MTTTALMPLDPSVSPQQAARILTIRANLLPQDISDGRRARRTRTVVILAVVLVLALLSGWYWHAAREKQTAEDDFAFITQQVTDVQKDQREYNDLTSTKNTITVMSSQLSKLMAKDAPWQTLLDEARTTGDKYDVKITQLDGTLATVPQAAETSDEIGSIVINGTAPDKKAVAKYMLALVALKAKGFADPFVSTVSGADKSGVSFTITVSLTKTALCGKFGKTCPSGGK
jgi:Tfp pilus assembly protein PilN